MPPPPVTSERVTPQASKTLTITLSKDRGIRQRQLAQAKALVQQRSSAALAPASTLSSSSACDTLEEQGEYCDPNSYGWVEVFDSYSEFGLDFELSARSKLGPVEINGPCLISVSGPYGSGVARCSELEELSKSRGGAAAVGVAVTLSELITVVSPKLPQCAKVALANKITVDQDAQWDYRAGAAAVQHQYAGGLGTIQWGSRVDVQYAQGAYTFFILSVNTTNNTVTLVSPSPAPADSACSK